MLGVPRAPLSATAAASGIVLFGSQPFGYPSVAYTTATRCVGWDLAQADAWSMAAVSEGTVGVVPPGTCIPIAAANGWAVIDSGPISTFGRAYEFALQVALPPPLPPVGKKRMPTPRL